MNYSDTERLIHLLGKIGYERTEVAEETDLYIFNTCSIRQKGEDRVYGKIRNVTEWKKRNPNLLIGLTGCMVRKTSTRSSSKQNRDKLIIKLKSLDFTLRITDLESVDKVIEEANNNAKMATKLVKEAEVEVKGEGESLASARAKSKKNALPPSKLKIRKLKDHELTEYLKVEPAYTSKFQAYVPIQIGCDQCCTYCIVPFARGREISRPMKDVLQECETLVKNGCKEITLGGQVVNSYGKSVIDKQSGLFSKDKDPFIELLRKVDALKGLGLKRLRFTSPHPRYFTDELVDLHTELETLVNHIHLPIQAGNNEVLKKMNRHYQIADYKKIWKRIKKILPGGSFTTDIIVGFCGETEEQFEETRKLYEEIRWDMAYLSRYSPREGTVSWNMWKDDVSREEKARRWKILNEMLEQCSIEYNESLIGKTLNVLVEKYNNKTGEIEGKSTENIVVQFRGDPSQVGELIDVKITKALTWVVKGDVS